MVYLYGRRQLCRRERHLRLIDEPWMSHQSPQRREHNAESRHKPTAWLTACHAPSVSCQCSLRRRWQC